MYLLDGIGTSWMMLHSLLGGCYFVGPLVSIVVLTLYPIPLLVDRIWWTGTLIGFWVIVGLTGLVISGPGGDFLSDIAGGLLNVLPFILPSIALPFAIMRYFFGWQFTVEGWGREPVPQRPSVKGLMIFTAFIALLVVLSQFTFNPEGIFIASICVFVASLLIFVPVTFVLFRLENYWTWLFGICIAITIIVFVFSFLTGVGIAEGFSIYSILVFVIGAYGMALIGIRLCNGRLWLHSDLVPESPVVPLTPEEDANPFR